MNEKYETETERLLNTLNKIKLGNKQGQFPTILISIRFDQVVVYERVAQYWVNTKN